MNARAPGAIGLSALLHAAVLGIILFFSYAATSVVKDNTVVFELVAGAGNNYAATAAPALGSAGGIKLTAPQVRPQPEQPTLKPKPVQPTLKAQASPIQAAPEPAVQKAAKPVDLVAELKKVEARREKRLEAKYKKAEEAEQKRLAQEQQAAKVSHIDAEGIKEGVIGGSAENKTGGAGGKALTREEGSELDAYFALLKARIKENHVPPEGVSMSLEARVEFFVAADGSVSHVRIARSSGNADYDRSVIEAVEHTASIGARPDNRGDTAGMIIQMKDEQGP